MPHLDYDYFARLLHEKKERLLKNRTGDGGWKHVSPKDSTGELSMIDNHPADFGSELFERSKDRSLQELDRRTLEEINRALERIANGSYGLCLACGREIGAERLKAHPYAGYCMNCQESQEIKNEGQKNVRPAEEPFLYPPFGRTFLDGKDYTGYDGEDAWQDVARYGTSSSPQDVPGETDNPSYVDSGENVGIVDKMDEYKSTRGVWKKKKK